MTDTKDTADKTLQGGAGRKPLSLQRTVESGHVRQSFSHGRSKSVVVEKRKTRKLATPGAAPEAEIAAPAPSAPKVEARAFQKPAPRPEPKGDAAKNDLLRPEERDARMRALTEARKQQAHEDAQRAEQARAAEAAAAAAPPEAKVAPADAAPAAPVSTSAPAAPQAPAVAARPAPAADRPVERAPVADRPASSGPRPQFGDRGPARPRPPASYDTRFAPREGGRPKNIDIPRAGVPPVGPSTRGAVAAEAGKLTKEAPQARPRPVNEAEEDDSRGGIKRGPGGAKVVRAPVKTTEEQRARGKLTINNALDEQQRERSLASLKRKR